MTTDNDTITIEADATTTREEALEAFNDIVRDAMAPLLAQIETNKAELATIRAARS